MFLGKGLKVRMATQKGLAPVYALAFGSICLVAPVLHAAQTDASASQVTSATQAIATWNVIALQTAASGPFSPPREARAMAMASAAVFDAVNSITQEHHAYKVRVVCNRSASIEAAVAGAAHGVLVALYPGAAQPLNATRDSALARIPAGRDRDEGLAAGQSVAAAVMAIRAGDRASEVVPYSPGTGVGAWVPTPPGFAAALEAGWGRVMPFFMDSGSQFRPGPPPAPGSETYARDYEEILSVGSSNSAKRAQPQTEAGRFWVATAAQLWNQVVRHLTVARAIDPATAARAYLLLNLAGTDALIAAWDAKFTYNQWRPITAIRSVPANGGAVMKSDTAWTPLIITPPFPDYPAGHTAYAGAAERVLGAVFGEKPGELSITSASASGATRRYQSFAQIAEEVTNARVWAGVHWRTSSTVGRALGLAVADLALARAPRRLDRD